MQDIEYTNSKIIMNKLTQETHSYIHNCLLQISYITNHRRLALTVPYYCLPIGY